jgi:DNA repair photolyase
MAEFGIAALTPTKARPNCVTGCENNCAYCSTKFSQVDRLKRVVDWEQQTVREDKIHAWAKYEGIVMFPTSHDITPNVYEPCLRQLRNLLNAGNEVLIASKPRIECIKNLMKDLVEHKEQIQFQFTITSLYNARLNLWEPGAPRIMERMTCLRAAYNAGWKTNVSIEPCLDVENVHAIVKRVIPFVTGVIWVGPLNLKKTFDNFDLGVSHNWLKKWRGADMQKDHKKLVAQYSDKVRFTKNFMRDMDR